ncbi:MAG: site-specific integrase [Nitrososphaerota archaeon]
MIFETLPAIPIKFEEFPHVTEEEVNLLLKNIKEPDKQLLIKILWHLGVRISEALNIKANDLIKKQDGYYLRIKRLKKKEETFDTLPIPLELALDIEKYIFDKNLKGEDKLFKITRVAVFSYLSKIGKKYLGKHIHPHMFRHGRVYHLIKKRVPTFLIVKLLGWSSLAVPLRYYHPSPDDVREALK